MDELLNNLAEKVFGPNWIAEREVEIRREIEILSAKISKMNAQIGRANFKLNDLLEQLENVQNGRAPFHTQNERWKAEHPKLIKRRSKP